MLLLTLRKQNGMSNAKSVDSVNWSYVVETLKQHKLYTEAAHVEDLWVAYLKTKGDLRYSQASTRILHDIAQEKY